MSETTRNTRDAAGELTALALADALRASFTAQRACQQRRTRARPIADPLPAP